MAIGKWNLFVTLCAGRMLEVLIDERGKSVLVKTIESLRPICFDFAE